MINTISTSRIDESKEGIDDAVKSYLNPHDRFATRMRASMKDNKGTPTSEEADAAEQKSLFVDAE